MRRLIIDTATDALSVALFADAEPIGHHHEIAGRGHAEKLLPIIAGMADGGRADSIWVDRGPGSFTGVRVGLACARALAYAWGAELLGYASLSLIAAMARTHAEGAAGPIAVAITGGHGELFWQLFDRLSLEPVEAARSTPITELARTLDATVVYGTGAAVLVAARGYGEAIDLRPDARQAPLLAPADISAEVGPLYGRGADAKPMMQTAAQQ